jgi:uncharacterized protein involved in cysteine biosynthesis
VGVFLIAGLVLGALLAEWLGDHLTLPSLHPALAAIVRALFQMGIIAGAMVLGVGLARLVSAPVLDHLSLYVELLATGRTIDSAKGLRWEILQSMARALYFVLRAPGIFLLALIPFVGPILGALWGAHALAVQETDAALTRRGLDFHRRRLWHRRYRAESLGFGLAGLVPVLAFPINLLLAPIVTPSLATGATLLVLDLERDASAPALPAPPR